MTIRNKFSLIAIIALLIGMAVFYYSRQNGQEAKIFLHAEAIQLPNGWGYNILSDKKVYIKQENIPGLPGNQTFKSAEDALKVGNLVVKKISANQLPTISMKDLQDLGIEK